MGVIKFLRQKRNIISLISLIGLGFILYEFIKNEKFSWIGLLIIIFTNLPQILSFWGDKDEKENETVFKLLIENTSLRKDVSQKEKDIISERTKNQEWENLISILKNKSLLKENLVRKYSNPLPIILFQYVNQKINNKAEKFITQKLEEEYNVKSLGGSLKVIPPNKVPKNIKNGVDLKKWFEKKIQSKFKNSSCVISVIAIADLKNVYWKSDYNFKVRYYTPLGDALKIDDIFNKNEIPSLLASENVSILDPILSGDLYFLCSQFMVDKELKILKDNQDEIERKISYTSLNELADVKIVNKISNAISKYFRDSDEVAKRINKEAKFWKEKLIKK